eukprot:6876656-Prymnesium_polylepis.1
MEGRRQGQRACHAVRRRASAPWIAAACQRAMGCQRRSQRACHGMPAARPARVPCGASGATSACAMRCQRRAPSCSHLGSDSHASSSS